MIATAVLLLNGSAAIILGDCLESLEDSKKQRAFEGRTFSLGMAHTYIAKSGPSRSVLEARELDITSASPRLTRYR